MVNKDTRILMIGASGRLGPHLLEFLRNEGFEVDCPSKKACNVLNLESIESYIHAYRPKYVVNLAAYTSVIGAGKDKKECFDVNTVGAYNVQRACSRQGVWRLVHISSDYAKVPESGTYAMSKYLSEKLMTGMTVIIRTSFKERKTWGVKGNRVVPHPVYTNADWIDIIAPKIGAIITKAWKYSGIVYVGTEMKTLLSLAKQEYPDVLPMELKEFRKLVGYDYPGDTTMPI